MRVNQSKANKIKGLFATLNKLELDHAISREDESTLRSPEYVFFECDIGYSDIYEDFSCEITSYKMARVYSYYINKYVYHSEISYGMFWPTSQTLWNDKCSYYEFRFIVQFVREAIKAGGTSFMKYASHKVTVDMPDYLNFELIKE